jgi:Methyltransferase FkbM domain
MAFRPLRLRRLVLWATLAGEGKITVPVATLDSLVEEGKVLPPDYVKMDIEGAELLALRGAARTFQRFHPVLFLASTARTWRESVAICLNRGAMDGAAWWTNLRMIQVSFLQNFLSSPTL